MTPFEYYQTQIKNNAISADPLQLVVLQKLDQLYQNLLSAQAKQNNFFAKLFYRRKIATKGLYLWGKVGIGKTFLMDCFYHCLPFEKKLRMHFYQFMQRVHAELKNLQGVKNPLERVAKKISEEAEVLCFDEFFVADITDAMILG